MRSEEINKKIRAEIREKRKKIKGEIREDYSKRAVKNALLFWQKNKVEIKSVALFFPLEEELNCLYLLEEFIKIGGIEIFFPAVIFKNQPLVWRKYPQDREVEFENDVMGIKTLKGENFKNLPDLIFIPLVAFNSKGERLGMGGGYYDRTLERKIISPKKKPYLCGLAYSLQKNEDFLKNNWDINLDALADERELLIF